MIPHHIARALVGALVTLTAMVAPARAAEPLVWGQERGFSIGAKLLVDGLGAHESPEPTAPIIDDIGAGIALVGGYSFTPHFHTRVTLGGAQHRTDVAGLNVQRSLATIEGHYRFMPERQVCPYVFGSIGGTDVRADYGVDHLKVTGAMAGLGAGTMVGLTRHVWMDVTVRLDGVNWHDARYWQDQADGTSIQVNDPIEDSGTSARLELGFVWAF